MSEIYRERKEGHNPLEVTKGRVPGTFKRYSKKDGN